MRAAKRSLILGFLIGCALIEPAFGALVLRTSGETVIRSMGPKRVAILVDTNGDKSIDQGFLLESELDLAAPSLVHFKNATLEFADGFARASEDQRMYELFVAGYPEPPAVEGETHVVRYTGFGITHRQGETKYNIDKARTDEEVSMPGW